MLKVVCLMKAKPGLSYEEFRDYYENNHVPMVLKLLPLMVDYRRSYLVPDSDSSLEHMGGATTHGFDVVTECWYRDQHDYDAMVALTRDTEIGRSLAENEANFIDQDAMVVFMADEYCTGASELAKAKEKALSDNKIDFIFRFRVKDGQQARYEAVVEKQLAITIEKDLGVLEYRVFRNADGGYCQHERYADEAALLLHMKNTKAELGEWFEITEIDQMIVLGDLSDEFRAGDAGAGADIYTDFRQFIR